MNGMWMLLHQIQNDASFSRHCAATSCRQTEDSYYHIEAPSSKVSGPISREPYMQQFVVAFALATFNAKSTSCSIYIEQVK